MVVNLLSEVGDGAGGGDEGGELEGVFGDLV